MNPADVDSVGGTQRAAKQAHQVFRGAAVRDHIDGGGIDVVILIRRGFFFEGGDEHLKIRRRDRADQLIGGDLIEVNHGPSVSRLGGD
jgi:hypothetical protein